jgi:hypothetical protein
MHNFYLVKKSNFIAQLEELGLLDKINRSKSYKEYSRRHSWYPEEYHLSNRKLYETLIQDKARSLDSENSSSPQIKIPVKIKAVLRKVPDPELIMMPVESSLSPTNPQASQLKDIPIEKKNSNFLDSLKKLSPRTQVQESKLDPPQEFVVTKREGPKDSESTVKSKSPDSKPTPALESEIPASDHIPQKPRFITRPKKYKRIPDSLVYKYRELIRSFHEKLPSPYVPSGTKKEKISIESLVSVHNQPNKGLTDFLDESKIPRYKRSLLNIKKPRRDPANTKNSESSASDISKLLDLTQFYAGTKHAIVNATDTVNTMPKTELNYTAQLTKDLTKFADLQISQSKERKAQLLKAFKIVQ